MGLLLLLCCTEVFAQIDKEKNRIFETDTARQVDSKTSTARGRGEWIVSAYIGAATTAPSALLISQPALGNNLSFDRVHFNGRSFVRPIYYGYRVGYFLPGASFLGLETEFIHLKVYAETERYVRATGTYRGEWMDRYLLLNKIVQGYSISHGLNFLLFNLAARYRLFSAERIILAARVGLGPTIPHTESNIDGSEQQQYELGPIGWQAAAGTEIRLWRGLHALGEYKFSRTRQRGKIFWGKAESLMHSHHGVVGLSYHF